MSDTKTRHPWEDVIERFPDVTSEEVQFASAAAHRKLLEADQRFVGLRDRRQHVLIHGTDEEIRQHDKDLKAVELEIERFNAIKDTLKPRLRETEERERREGAKRIAAELPERIEAVEAARGAYDNALDHLRGASSALLGTGVKVDPDVRKRAEELLEAPLGRESGVMLRHK